MRDTGHEVRQLDDNTYVVLEDYVELEPRKELGRAQREGSGYPWKVTKIQWRGANGCGEVGGFPGGHMDIGRVEANVSKALQHKLIVAMLKTL